MQKLRYLLWVSVVVMFCLALRLFYQHCEVVVERVVVIRYSHYAKGANVYRTVKDVEGVSEAAEEKRYEDSRRFLAELMHEWRSTEFVESLAKAVCEGDVELDPEIVVEASRSLRVELDSLDRGSGAAKGQFTVRAKGRVLAERLTVSCKKKMQQSVAEFNRLQFMRCASLEQARKQRLETDLMGLRAELAMAESTSDKSSNDLHKRIMSTEDELVSVVKSIERLQEKCARDGAVISFENGESSCVPR